MALPKQRPGKRVKLAVRLGETCTEIEVYVARVFRNAVESASMRQRMSMSRGLQMKIRVPMENSESITGING